MPHLGGAPDPAVFDHVVGLIAPLGWHLCLHVDGAMLPELLPRLLTLPLPFMVDHMGRLKAADGLDSPAMRALLGLAEVRDAWVKVSGIDRIASGKRPCGDSRVVAWMHWSSYALLMRVSMYRMQTRRCSCLAH